MCWALRATCQPARCLQSIAQRNCTHGLAGWPALAFLPTPPAPVRMAWMAATASTAPAAPSRCPIMLFVELIFKCLWGRAVVMARYSAMSPAGVEVACALT